MCSTVLYASRCLSTAVPFLMLACALVSHGVMTSLIVQAIAMSHGNWISQDQVRKAATPGAPGCSGGDPAHGYELDTTNIAGRTPLPPALSNR